jgi:hypothetical protein
VSFSFFISLDDVRKDKNFAVDDVRKDEDFAADDVRKHEDFPVDDVRNVWLWAWFSVISYDVISDIGNVFTTLSLVV